MFLTSLLLVAGIAGCQTDTSTKLAQKGSKPIVIELFTSQGCSSCPPAEELLTQMSDNDTNLLLLSFHVDYWNRLGWIDTFSNKIFSDRQYNYANAFGLRSVYTPQAVVGGRFETVGSNRHNLTNIINKGVSYQNIIAQTEATFVNNKLTVTIKSITPNNCNLMALLVKNEAATKINGGENEGLLLNHKNIVMDIKQVDKHQNKADFTLTEASNHYKVVILAQKEDDYKIEDVAVVKLL